MTSRRDVRFKATPEAQDRYCTSCGAQVIWIVTGRGFRMPLSKASWRSEDETYLSHLADCPNAGFHRRSTPKATP
jgi:predicted RNA-binding Zn-ribbon protein involved in translation (DUF1610 family)